MKNTLITLASVATLAVTANAQTITNGSFETAGTWNQYGSTSPASSLFPYAVGGGGVTSATSGSNVVILNADGATQTAGISQTVSFASAGSYNLTFDYSLQAGSATDTQDLQVLLDGVILNTYNVSGGSTNVYTAGSVNLSGVTAGNHDIQFLALNANSSNSVILDSVAISVPEPSSTALLGLGGLALILRRKK